MRIFAAVVVAAGVGAGAGGAAAQQATLVEIDDNVMVTPLGMQADRLDQRSVFDAAGNEIGEVEEALGTSPTTPTALAIEFDGAGWFDADKTRIVDISEISLAEDRLTIGLDKAGALALPAYTGD